MLKKAFEAIVIGAGINGSASALHLAGFGCKTALIEQFAVPHSRGSSAGHSRLTRLSSTSAEDFLPILIDSFKQWEKLEMQTGISLLKPCKVYHLSDDSQQKDLKLMYKSLMNLGISPQFTTGREFNEIYKTTYKPDTTILEDPKSGILLASKCLQTIQNKFCEKGGKILDEFPISDIEIAPNGGVTVRGIKGSIEGDYLVICGGPWSSNILSKIDIKIPLRTLKVEVNYCHIRKNNAKPFILRHFFDEEKHVYGLPSFEYPNMIKIGVHDGIERDPDHRDTIEEDSKLIEMRKRVSQYIKENIPWLDPNPAVIEPCMYTMSQDEEYIIDQHPHYKNIAFGCGFSGSGFKTALTVGQILSEIVLGKNCNFDVSAFRANRFKI